MKRQNGSIVICLAALVGLISLSGCMKTDKIAKAGDDGLNLPSTPYQYNSAFSSNDNVPTLGRVLFYDNRFRPTIPYRAHPVTSKAWHSLTTLL